MSTDAETIAKAAKQAFEASQLISAHERVRALHEIRKELEASKVAILEANIMDMDVCALCSLLRFVGRLTSTTLSSHYHAFTLPSPSPFTLPISRQNTWPTSEYQAAQAEVAAGNLSDSLLKRLDLGKGDKWDQMIQGLLDVANLPDPNGNVSYASELDEGLDLYRISCPIGVLLVIFEARPEVVVNIASLAIKSGTSQIYTIKR